MDPYITVCRERDYDFQKIKFDNFFDCVDNLGNTVMTIDEQRRIYDLLISIISKQNIFYPIHNVMFDKHESIVLCNIDTIFNLFKVEYSPVLKRSDKRIWFCELGASTMYEYMLWRFYNSIGYGIMTKQQFEQSPFNIERYNAMLLPESKVDHSYLRKNLIQKTGGVDLMIINEELDFNYIKDMILYGIRPKGNCLMLLESYNVKKNNTKITDIITMFNKVALIKPMTTDKTYLVMTDKREIGDILEEGNNTIRSEKLIEYLENYNKLNNKLNDKKEVLYYLNRANVHFCIY